jgi:hypothetical protein
LQLLKNDCIIKGSRSKNQKQGRKLYNREKQSKSKNLAKVGKRSQKAAKNSTKTKKSSNPSQSSKQREILYASKIAKMALRQNPKKKNFP